MTTSERSIPKSFLAEGMALTKGATVFGVPMESLNRDEALACAAKFGKMYSDTLQDNIRRWDFMSELRRAEANAPAHRPEATK